MLIRNGSVWTGNESQPTAEAVAVRDGRIVAVGTESDARARLGRDAEEIDAGGRTVLPGFLDVHNHYLATAEQLASVDLRYPAVASISDLTRAIAEAAENTPDGRWIRGFSLDWAKFPDGRLPTRDDLDAATQVHPVIVYHVSGHHALVNTAAMLDRGILESAADPSGGKFVRDEGGRLTGLCLDSATSKILPVELDIGCHGPNFHTILPGQDTVALLDAASHEYLKVGLTTICDPQVTRREMKGYREAHRQGVLRLRVIMMPLSNHLDDFISIGMAGPFGDDQLMVGPMKLYSDGTLIGGTAWFTEPYGEQGQFTGSTYWKPNELAELVTRAHAAGWQVGIHTGGDAAMEMTINAIEAGLRANPRLDTRHRIEHCFYPTPQQIERMASLGIIPVNQPNMLCDCGDEFVSRLGQRAHRLEPMREELDAGIKPVLSSDAFVTSFNPLHTIANALDRKTRQGQPIGEEQRLTLEEALRAHTIDAAVSIRMEDRLGSLEVGKLADIAILDGDLNAAAPAEIRDIPIWRTILGGEVLWSAPPA
ncbi:MAG TPA: amidohydrolase [Thermomicrobiales bacterium]|nr:amidohydrolase [Thermomicrobiales bacterium]